MLVKISVVVLLFISVSTHVFAKGCPNAKQQFIQEFQNEPKNNLNRDQVKKLRMKVLKRGMYKKRCRTEIREKIRMANDRKVRSPKRPNLQSSRPSTPNSSKTCPKGLYEGYQVHSDRCIAGQTLDIIKEFLL